MSLRGVSLCTPFIQTFFLSVSSRRADCSLSNAKKLISSRLLSQPSRISWEFFLVLKLWQPVKSQMLSMRFVLP